MDMVAEAIKPVRMPNSIVEVGPGLDNILYRDSLYGLLPPKGRNDAIKRIAVFLPTDDCAPTFVFNDEKVRVVRSDIYKEKPALAAESAAIVVMQNVVGDTSYFQTDDYCSPKDFSRMEEWCNHVLCPGGLLLLIDTVQRNRALHDKVTQVLLAKKRFKSIHPEQDDRKQPRIYLFDYLVGTLDSFGCLDDYTASLIKSLKRILAHDDLVYVYEKN